MSESAATQFDYEEQLSKLRSRVKECEQRRLDVEARLTAENQSLKDQLDKVNGQLEKMQFEASMKQEKSRMKVAYRLETYQSFRVLKIYLLHCYLFLFS